MSIYIEILAIVEKSQNGKEVTEVQKINLKKLSKLKLMKQFT